MGTLINFSLIVLGTLCLFGGMNYFNKEKTEQSFGLYVLLLGIFSSIWIFAFDLTGMVREFPTIRFLRTLGMTGVMGYITVLLFMLAAIVKISKKNTWPVMIVYIIYSVFVLYKFAPMDEPEFIDFNGRRTYYPGTSDSFVWQTVQFILTFIIALLCSLYWLFSKQEKANKKIITILICSHTAMFLSAIPDAVLVYMGFPFFPTSCYGIALAYLILCYNCTKNNALEITIQNISSYIYQADNVNILVFNMKDILDKANNSSLEFLGLEKAEGQHLHDLFDMTEGEEKNLWNQIRRNDNYSAKLFTKNKKTSCSLIFNTVKDKKGHPYCTIIYINDLTREEKIQEGLRLASEAKSTFISSMSHEIRTPINAIIGMNEMIMRESSEPGILDYARTIRNSSEILLGIVNNLLDISKIEAGKTTLNESPYLLSELLTECCKMISERAREKNLSVILECNPSNPSELYGDSLKIRQIILNLLTNAVKYTEKGKIIFMVGGELTDSNFYLQISVSDTGRGIKKENLQSLFNPFERLDMNASRTIEGTGLGLNITKKYVEFMNGEITVESEYGKGSLFTVTIPQRIMDSKPVGEINLKPIQEEYKYTCSFTAPSARILVVDDMEINLKVFSSLLKETKLNIDTSTSGYDCIDLAKKNSYDVIFLDHMMPGMDGIQTFEELKKNDRCRETPVIILTANAVRGMKEKFLSIGFSDFISKPIDYKTLEQKIMQYLPESKISRAEPAVRTLQKESSNSMEQKLKQFSELTGQNLSQAMEYCAESEKLLFECLMNFTDRERISELQKYFDMADWEQYSITIHSIKTQAKMLGFEKLGEKAEKLQFAAESKSIQEIDRYHAEIVSEMKLIGDHSVVLGQGRIV